MTILFIADIHLSIKKPKVVNGFLHFLNHRAIHAHALYILGDLFETWVGDDEQNILHIKIANALQKLHQKKIPCYFIHGNHDFLLGKKYANLCGMTLLPNNQILQLQSGKKIIILHGDTLCVNNISYQRLRVYCNYRIIQQFFLFLPIFIRIYIFNIVRSYCTQHKKHQIKNQSHIDSRMVADILIKHRSEIMIHGHTHQPKIHNIYCSNTKIIFKRIVLGCWNQYGSILEINEENNNFNLIQFPLYTIK